MQTSSNSFATSLFLNALSRNKWSKKLDKKILDSSDDDSYDYPSKPLLNV
jgi:hypothetical protein